LVVVLLIGLIGAGLAGWRYVESYQSTDDAEIDGHIHAISSRIQGSVTRVWVEDNQHVKKGQILVELDPRDFQVAVEQARASLSQALADIKVSRQNHETAVANLHATEADNYRAQRDADRYRILLTQQVVAQAEFDQYSATAKTDAAKVTADRANSDSALRTIALKEAAAEAAQAALDQALLNLSYTKIYAPDDGVIGKKTVETGQRVDPGESLMAVVDVQDLWVTANFKENQLARMRRGERVTIHVDALGGDFRGYVEAMPGATGEKFSVLPPENATGNYVKVVQRLPVRIAFDQDQNPQHKFRPGMSVEPTVWLQSAPAVREENFARWWRGLK
jgi:membrane fusion protein (multidrug efflux system)